MAVLQLHYLLTSFWLAVWIPVNWIIPLYHGSIWFVYAVFQAIYFAAGGDVGSDPTAFHSFSALSVLLGIILGWLLQTFVPSPMLISTRTGWESTMFVKVPVLTLLFVGAQLFYAQMPPSTDTPWGVILTALLTTAIVVVTWVWSYTEPWARNDGKATFVSFMWWAGINFFVAIAFLLGYTDLADRYVAFIAGGGAIVLFLLVQFIFPGSSGWARFAGPPKAMVIFAPTSNGE